MIAAECLAEVVGIGVIGVIAERFKRWDLVGAEIWEGFEVGFELRVKAYIWKMSELFTHMKVNAFLFQSLCAFCRAKQRVLGKARGGRRSKRVQTGSQWACL